MRVDVGKSKIRDSGRRLQVLKKNTKPSAMQCSDAALIWNASQVKQVFDGRKATAGKEKEVLWQSAVGRLRKFVPL